MSAKWRRSKKLLRWSDQQVPRRSCKTMPIETFRRIRCVHPQKYRSSSFDSRRWKEPKPLIDIFQESNWITIVAEIAGFNKETLKIDVRDQKLTLSARAKDRRFYKSLNLPKVVIPNVMYTTYKNGVLEIRLRKAVKEEAIRKQVG